MDIKWFKSLDYDYLKKIAPQYAEEYRIKVRLYMIRHFE